MDPQGRRKTITRRLTEAELTAWQPLFDNAKKIRAMLAELQDLTLEIIETSLGLKQWHLNHAKPRDSRRLNL